MHGAALAATYAPGLAHKFRHQGPKCCTLTNGVTMAAVVARHIIAFAQRHGGTHHLRFLPDRRVNRARNLTALDHFGSALVKVTDT